MKLGIIGSGMIVQEFLPSLRAMDGVEIVAVQGAPGRMEKVRALCGRYAIPHAVDNIDDLCAAGADTAYIAVPNSLHVSFCAEALEHGLHAIVEKPLASNVREARTLQDMAEKRGRFLFEAVTTPYLGVYQKVREWLPRVGDVQLVQSQFCQFSSRYGLFLSGQTPPAFDPAKSGGAMMDLNLYNLHFVLGLFGPPESADYFPNVQRGIDTSGILRMCYPAFQALCVASKDCGGPTGAWIQGTKGVLRTTASANVVGKAVLSLYDGTTEEFDDGGGSNRVIPEFTAFRRAMETGDFAFCREMLDRSLAVSAVQTRARMRAGIVFPADRAET